MITNVSFYTYNLPLKNPLTLGAETLTNRTGLLLKVNHEPDLIGWGEIAPLPSFSTETVSELLPQLRELKQKLEGHPIPRDIVALTSQCYPSIRFGVESAILMIGAASKKVTLGQMINPTAVKPIPLQALLSGSKEAVVTKAQERFANGYRAFKLKVGRLKQSEDLEIIAVLRKELGDRITIRLDANRAFDYDEGVSFLNGLKPYNIEFIEEPFQSLELLAKYLKEQESKIIALDESLREKSQTELETIIDFDRVKALVIKPSMHGYLESISLVRLALEKKLTPVFSSSYESGLGLYLIGVMASTVSDTLPVGLDTYDQLTDDIIVPRLEFTDGTFDTYAHHDIANRIQVEKLTELS